MATCKKTQELSPAEEVFVQEYARHEDSNKAYRVAYPERLGVKATTIEQQASRLLHSAKIQAAIKSITRGIRTHTIIEQADVVEWNWQQAHDTSHPIAARIDAMREVSRILRFYPDKNAQPSGDNGEGRQALVNGAAEILLAIRERRPELFAKQIKAYEAEAREALTQQETEDA